MNATDFLPNEEQEFIDQKGLLDDLQMRTHYGRSHFASRMPFCTGQEEAATIAFEHLWIMEDELGESIPSLHKEMEPFSTITHSLSLLESRSVLHVVDLFEIKKFLYHYRRFFLQLSRFPKTTTISRLTSLQEPWDVLDPHQRGTFFFRVETDTSKHLLSKILVIQKKIRIAMRKRALLLKQQFDIDLKHTHEFVIPRNDMRKNPLLTTGLVALKKETTYSFVFELMGDDAVFLMKQKQDQLEIQLEEEEKRYITLISHRLFEHVGTLIDHVKWIGFLDFQFSCILWKQKWKGAYPKILSPRNPVIIHEGRSIPMLRLCAEQKRPYDCLDLELAYGVTLITGANMGGKTEALKTIGQLVFLCAMGIPIPAKKMDTPLFRGIRSIYRTKEEAGLSGFGMEISRTTSTLNQRTDRLILIDEFGSTTQPSEGEALAIALVAFFQKHPDSLVVFVTHFSRLIPRVPNAYYTGLLKEGFPEHLPPNEVSLWIDHTVRPIHSKKIPQVALIIAQALGLPDEIIETAKLMREGKEQSSV